MFWRAFGGLAVIAFLLYGLFALFFGRGHVDCGWGSSWDSEAGRCVYECEWRLGNDRTACLDALEFQALRLLRDIRELRR